jgi:hypothetical protein
MVRQCSTFKDLSNVDLHAVFVRPLTLQNRIKIYLNLKLKINFNCERQTVSQLTFWIIGFEVFCKKKLDKRMDCTMYIFLMIQKM